MSKFLNTKDFFLCTGGIMPAQMQTHQQVVSKKDGETKFLTKIDTHTTSIADFSCKKMMILMAIIAVVICALTIATGGAALIAAAAIGGAVGAAAGALICGCQGAAARMWFEYKENVKLGPLQVPAVTDKAHMKCSIFNEEIRLAPHIKNWWQAALVGISNFAGEMFKCVMVGAAAAGVAVLASEGVLAFLGNAVMNWGASFGLGGLMLRGGMGLNQMVQDEYVNGQGASADSFASGFWSMETGTAHSAYNVATGQGKPEDYAGLLAWGAPIGRAEETKPLDVDAVGNNAWEGKPQSGKTGYLESPRLNRAEVQGFKENMKQQGIDVVIDKKGVLPESARAGFDPKTGTIYLRKGATDYEAFHESKHAEQWKELGKENYLKQSTLEREQYVYDQIMKNKDRFSPAELEHAKNYINRVRNQHGVEPVDAMETLPKGDLGESGNSGKGADGDVYEDASSKNNADAVVQNELPRSSDLPSKSIVPGDKIAGIPVVDVKNGTNGTVAVIGRKMAGHVEAVGAELKNDRNIELFNEEFQKNNTFVIDGKTYTWEQVVDDFKNEYGQYRTNSKGWIIDEDLPNTLMYKANKAWAEKLINEEYTVIDVGYPSTVNTESVFYNMEQSIIFNK